MSLVNFVEVETRWGIRTCALHHCDIANLDQPVDVLAVSVLSGDLDAFDGDPRLYHNVPHTLIGALYLDLGIDVARLRRDCTLDLRTGLGCWISKPITKGPKKHSIGRVLCIEDIGIRADLETSLADLFVALPVFEAKGVKIGSLGLPVLGTGAWGQDAEPAIRELLRGAEHVLSRLESLEHVLFLENSEFKAGELGRAMDSVLGRVRVTLPKGAAGEGVRREIADAAEALQVLVDASRGAVLADVLRIVSSAEARSHEVGIVGRRLVEAVLLELQPSKAGRELWRGIDALAELGVAGWMRSYMHTLRILGNESVHEKAQQRFPNSVVEADILVALFCIQRVLTFWTDWSRSRQ